jgi:polyferredoxin
MNEKEKVTRPKKYLWPFVLATVFSLPDVDLVLSNMFNMPHIVPNLHLTLFDVFAVIWIIIILAVIASVFVVASWLMSPFWCRFILPFYLLAILVVCKWIFFSPYSGP